MSYRAFSSADLATSLAAGVAGAVVLTVVHETTRRVTARAPRMDVLGERGLAKVMRGVGLAVPGQPTLHRLALGGDLLGNSLYYALVGSGRDAPVRGAGLGLIAGIGAVVLPPHLGLGRGPRGITRRVQAMTIACYLLGGLVAGATARWLGGASRHA